MDEAHPETNQSLMRRFKSLLERFCTAINDEGYTLRPYRGSSPEFFDRLPCAAKESILDNFSRYCQICDAVIGQGYSMTNDAAMLRQALHTFGLITPTDFITRRFDPDDVIEIYDRSMVQIFRNARFFKVIGYTLDDVLCRPFYELYRRDEKITNDLLHVGRQMFDGAIRKTYYWGSAAIHSVEEIDSPNHYRTLCQAILLAPLVDVQGSIVAVASVIKDVSPPPSTAD